MDANAAVALELSGRKFRPGFWPQFWPQFFNKRGLLNFLLLPFAAVFAVAVVARRWLYAVGIFSSIHCGAFVVVVGNVVAGGGGKTPVVIALANALQKRGLRVGVVSRGYGGKNSAPLLVTDKTNWRECGDEPLLIKRQTGAPVCVAWRRAAAAEKLAAAGECEVIISDDGLQHYAMKRDMEICVTKQNFGFGNGWFLPAGPLREGRRRAAACDVLLTVGGEDAPLETIGMYPLNEPQKTIPPADFAARLAGRKIAALAGIARPQSFFATLAAHGIVLSAARPLPDHGVLREKELKEIPADAILMTEKDAVKYGDAVDSRLYVFAVRCKLPDSLPEKIFAAAKEKENKK